MSDSLTKFKIVNLKKENLFLIPLWDERARPLFSHFSAISLLNITLIRYLTTSRKSGQDMNKSFNNLSHVTNLFKKNILFNI